MSLEEFQRRLETALGKLDDDERELIETIHNGAEVHHTARYLLVASALSFLAGGLAAALAL